MRDADDDGSGARFREELCLDIFFFLDLHWIWLCERSRVP